MFRKSFLFVFTAAVIAFSINANAADKKPEKEAKKSVGLLEKLNAGELKKEIKKPKKPKLVHVNQTHDITVQAPSNQVLKIHKSNVKKCEELDCIIIESYVLSDDFGATAELKARVPDYTFEDFIVALGQAPAKIVLHDIKAKDVTEQTLDAEARLKAKTALRDNLVRMLEMKPNSHVSDVLEIERELSRIQEDVESYQAKLKYLKRVGNMMLVNVSYQNPKASEGVDTSIVTRASAKAEDVFVESLSKAILFVALVLPWVPITIAGLWILIRLFRGKKAKAKKEKKGKEKKTASVEPATAPAPAPAPAAATPAPTAPPAGKAPAAEGAAPAEEGKEKKGFLKIKMPEKK